MTEEHFTVQVTNVEEDGFVSMNWIQPEIGTVLITATLDDGDAEDYRHPVEVVHLQGDQPRRG